mgnify:CR=1 FL=1|tara:strand:+ start:119 stop:1216 length:1098 start_codon:yes stop_codon:yes gene_type:complete
MAKNLNFFPMLLFLVATLSAQDGKNYDWYDPTDSVIKFEGQGWGDSGYNRLPDYAKKTVREAVWNLSRQSAGLGIRFETDADSISIQYQVNGQLAMNHMPATGVSGIDLYVKQLDSWSWCRGRYQFKDTIRYDFITDALAKGKREYQLFFPLYNNITNLKIGVPKGKFLAYKPSRTEKPIVIYGTSIAQGGCASRPGMAWTNILSRKLDYPVINLGFSGNGRLEPALTDLLNELDAAVYVLDCLPNLSPNKEHTKTEIQKRIRNSVASLKAKHPDTPVLLVQHAGYSDGEVDMNRASVYKTLNGWMSEIFGDLKKEGVKNLYMLSKKEINLSNDAFVDGTHPTDLGMLQYAEAYERIIPELLIVK